MTLIRTGQKIIEIKGSIAGNIFTRDRSGQHIRAKPKRVQQRTAKQHVQRNAFTQARAFSKVNRTVSYNIYRALNNLDMKEPPIDYSIPKL